MKNNGFLTLDSIIESMHDYIEGLEIYVWSTTREEWAEMLMQDLTEEEHPDYAVSYQDIVNAIIDILDERGKVLHWYFIQDATDSKGILDETLLNAKDIADAEQQALVKWSKMSEHDRKLTKQAWIALYPHTPDKTIDYSKEEQFLAIK